LWPSDGFPSHVSCIHILIRDLTPDTRGRSRMREIRSYGSARGVPGNRHSYRNYVPKGYGMGFLATLFLRLRLRPLIVRHLVRPVSLSLVEPGRFQEQIGSIVEWIVLDLVAACLEKGIPGDVHPVELIGDQALHVGADGLPFVRFQSTAPLVHQVFQLGI